MSVLARACTPAGVFICIAASQPSSTIYTTEKQKRFHFFGNFLRKFFDYPIAVIEMEVKMSENIQIKDRLAGLNQFIYLSTSSGSMDGCRNMFRPLASIFDISLIISSISFGVTTRFPT